MVLGKLVEIINDMKIGLDPDILARWYTVIEGDAKTMCPPNLKNSISVMRDPILPFRFEFKASKRALPWVIDAIERNLNNMPFATRMYFQKLEGIIASKNSQLADPLQK